MNTPYVSRLLPHSNFWVRVSALWGLLLGNGIALAVTSVVIYLSGGGRLGVEIGCAMVLVFCIVGGLAVCEEATVFESLPHWMLFFSTLCAFTIMGIFMPLLVIAYLVLIIVGLLRQKASRKVPSLSRFLNGLPA